MRGEAACRVIVPVPADVVFDAWADVRAYPNWLEHLENVHVIDSRRSVWVMRGRRGTRAQWETEVTVAKRGRAFAWSSTAGDIVTYGKVKLEALGPRKTRIVFARFISGPGQAALETWFADPDAKIRRDLEAFVGELKRRTGKKDALRLA